MRVRVIGEWGTMPINAAERGEVQGAGPTVVGDGHWPPSRADVAALRC
ncbi:MAG: hypothetical protein JSU08_18990 [Acidobacteria bacterium]|nr:hypothetical protein [Acidobacteriota bacterium]